MLKILLNECICLKLQMECDEASMLSLSDAGISPPWSLGWGICVIWCRNSISGSSDCRQYFIPCLLRYSNWKLSDCNNILSLVYSDTQNLGNCKISFLPSFCLNYYFQAQKFRKWMRREWAIFTVNGPINMFKFYQNEPCFPYLGSTLMSHITSEHLKEEQLIHLVSQRKSRS